MQTHTRRSRRLAFAVATVALVVLAGAFLAPGATGRSAPSASATTAAAPTQSAPPTQAAPTPRTPVPTPIPVQPQAIARWRDARFGMFIHWGPVSLTGKEIGWARGRHDADRRIRRPLQALQPDEVQPRRVGAVAKAAGMKYMVLTTKHHDGFVPVGHEADAVQHHELAPQARRGEGVVRRPRASRASGSAPTTPRATGATPTSR